MYIWKENRNIHAPKKDGVLTVSITIQIIKGEDICKAYRGQPPTEYSPIKQ